LTAHSSVGFFAILLLFALIRNMKESSLKWQILITLSIALLINIRPADAALSVCPMLIYVIIEMTRSRDKANYFKTLLFAGIGIAVGVLVLGAVNYIQNGDPLKLGFIIYNPREKYGFSGVHNIYGGIWNDTFSLMKLALWHIPLYLEIAIAGLLERKGKLSFIGWILILNILFFLGYYAIGIRFFFVPYLLLAVPFARGLIMLEKYIEEKWKVRQFGARIFIPSAIIISLFFLYPHILKTSSVIFKKYDYINGILQSRAPQTQKSLIFLIHSGYVDTNNPPDLKEKIMKVLFLEPEMNAKLIRQYPDREPYIFHFDFQKNAYVLQPYPDELFNLSGKVEKEYMSWAYLNAGLNYDIRVKDMNKSRKCFKQAIKLSPKNSGIRLNLAFLYYKWGKLDEAASEYKEILRIDPKMNEPLYYLGRIEGMRGKYEESLAYLNRYVEREKTGTLVIKALGWIRKYSQMQSNGRR